MTKLSPKTQRLVLDMIEDGVLPEKARKASFESVEAMMEARIERNTLGPRWRAVKKLYKLNHRRTKSLLRHAHRDARDAQGFEPPRTEETKI